MEKNLLETVKSKLLLADGAWGTILQEKGLAPGECPELWNEIHRDEVLDIAKSYIAAGSDIIETNSFGGSKIKLEDYNYADRCYEFNKLAAQISREAAGQNAFVFGSVGPTGKFLITGEISKEEMLESFQIQINGLVDGGVDAICMETFYDYEEAEAAVSAAKMTSKLPVICTFTFEKSPSGSFASIMGVKPEDLSSKLMDIGVDIIGTNCGNGIVDMIKIVEQIRFYNSIIPILIQSNAGMPVIEKDSLVYPETPDFFGENLRNIIKAGANIVGGCCGTTPEHIKRLRLEINKINNELG